MSICDKCKNKDICKYTEEVKKLENNQVKTNIEFIHQEIICDKKAEDNYIPAIPCCIHPEISFCQYKNNGGCTNLNNICPYNEGIRYLTNTELIR